MEKRVFECKLCGNKFSPSYRLSRHRNLEYCSKICAGKIKANGIYHRASDIKLSAIEKIKQKGRYMTKGEICNSLQISSKTLTAYNVSIIECNKLAGFKQPRRFFEQLVYEVLADIYDVRREVSFETCLSPKGNLLRFDFMLIGANVLIEADGDQHKERENSWWSSYRQLCDEIKNKYAKDEGFILIRIPYQNILTKEYVLSYLAEAYKTTTQSVMVNVTV